MVGISWLSFSLWLCSLHLALESDAVYLCLTCEVEDTLFLTSTGDEDILVCEWKVFSFKHSLGCCDSLLRISIVDVYDFLCCRL